MSVALNGVGLPGLRAKDPDRIERAPYLRGRGRFGEAPNSFTIGAGLRVG